MHLYRLFDHPPYRIDTFSQYTHFHHLPWIMYVFLCTCRPSALYNPRATPLSLSVIPFRPPTSQPASQPDKRSTSKPVHQLTRCQPVHQGTIGFYSREGLYQYSSLHGFELTSTFFRAFMDSNWALSVTWLDLS